MTSFTEALLLTVAALLKIASCSAGDPVFVTDSACTRGRRCSCLSGWRNDLGPRRRSAPRGFDIVRDLLGKSVNDGLRVTWWEEGERRSVNHAQSLNANYARLRVDHGSRVIPPPHAAGTRGVPHRHDGVLDHREDVFVALDLFAGIVLVRMGEDALRKGGREDGADALVSRDRDRLVDWMGEPLRVDEGRVVGVRAPDGYGTPAQRGGKSGEHRRILVPVLWLFGQEGVELPNITRSAQVLDMWPARW